MTAEIMAIDIDLHRWHCWSSELGRIAYKERSVALFQASLREAERRGATVLIECASPIVYGAEPAKLWNALRWMVWNSYMVGIARMSGARNPVLVAPSSKWAHEHPEKDRHAIFDIKGDNHDIRECRCMIEFYKLHPEDWVPIDDYMASL